MTKKILIAEDDYAISLAIKTIVSGACDCELTLVEDGEAAWQAIQENAFDLIISDWNMPLKTGAELVDDMRRSSPPMDTPFLMLTARSDKDSVLGAIQAGVTEYMHKPFDRLALIEKVTKLLNIVPQDSTVELLDLPDDDSLQEG